MGNTFQYLFFNTYAGYFLQVLPVALLAGALCLLIRRGVGNRRGLRRAWPRELVMALFACYLAGLWALVLTPHNLWVDLWYRLLYHSPSGNTIAPPLWDVSRWVFDPHVSLFDAFTSENLGNILLFVPLGLFLPLLWPRLAWLPTLFLGIAVSAAVELLQMPIGRSFDSNDLITNAVGAAAGLLLFLLIRLCVPGLTKAVGNETKDVTS